MLKSVDDQLQEVTPPPRAVSHPAGSVISTSSISGVSRVSSVSSISSVSGITIIMISSQVKKK